MVGSKIGKMWRGVNFVGATTKDDNGSIRWESSLGGYLIEREQMGLGLLWVVIMCDNTCPLFCKMLMCHAMIGGCKLRILYYILIKFWLIFPSQNLRIF